jgi:tRNA dimethylallyltransferase
VGGSGFYLKALRHGLWDAPATSPEFRASLDQTTNAQLHQQLQELDPEHATKVSAEDRYRMVRALEILHISGRRPSELQKEMNPEPNPNFELWVLEREPEELRARIRARIESMLNQGWIDEVIRLRDHYPTSRMLHAVGYQQVLDFLNGDEPEGRKVEPGIPGLINEIDLAHRQLAKSQRTWLKNLKPDATYMLPGDNPMLIERFLQNHC